MSANARDMGSISGLGRSEKEMEMEMEMENHSSVLAWEITWTRTLVGYSPLGHKRVGHNLVTKKNKQTNKKKKQKKPHELLQLSYQRCTQVPVAF